MKVQHYHVEENLVTVPSQIGIGKTDIGQLASSFVKSSRATKPHKVRFGRTSYLVGQNVERYTKPIQRMDFNRLGDTAEAKALTYVSLGLALGPAPKHPANIVVGFPVSVMADTEQAKSVSKMLKGWLVGSHKFEIDDVEYSFEVNSVKIITQPLGAYYAWATTNDGKFKVPTEVAMGRILIVDIGFNTLDLYGLRDGQIEPSSTAGDTTGIRRAAEMLQSHIKFEFDVHLSRLECNDLLASSSPLLETAGKTVDLTSIVQQSLEATAAQIGDFCETTVGNAKQFGRILSGGGGAEMLRKHILARYPSALVLPNAVMANAIGFAHAGRIKWPNAPIVVGLDPGFGGFKVAVLNLVEDGD